ncbi:MAG: hypothetical protein H7831_11015 [Magnetococcus sp. WYHC-3]
MPIHPILQRLSTLGSTTRGEVRASPAGVGHWPRPAVSPLGLARDWFDHLGLTRNLRGPWSRRRLQWGGGALSLLALDLLLSRGILGAAGDDQPTVGWMTVAGLFGLTWGLFALGLWPLLRERGLITPRQRFDARSDTALMDYCQRYSDTAVARYWEDPLTDSLDVDPALDVARFRALAAPGDLRTSFPGHLVAAQSAFAPGRPLQPPPPLPPLATPETDTAMPADWSRDDGRQPATPAALELGSRTPRRPPAVSRDDIFPFPEEPPEDDASTPAPPLPPRYDPAADLLALRARAERLIPPREETTPWERQSFEDQLSSRWNPS